MVQRLHVPVSDQQHLGVPVPLLSGALLHGDRGAPEALFALREVSVHQGDPLLLLLASLRLHRAPQDELIRSGISECRSKPDYICGNGLRGDRTESRVQLQAAHGRGTECQTEQHTDNIGPTERTFGCITRHGCSVQEHDLCVECEGRALGCPQHLHECPGASG